MKRVLVYCATGYGEKVLYSLDDAEYNVIAYVDQNPEIWGTHLNGVVVIPPETITDYAFDNIIVSRAIYEKEISHYLVHELKIDPNKIVVFTPNYNGVIFQEERIVMLRKCIDMIKMRNIPGNMAEVGVYRGDFAKLMNRYLPDKRLYLFDTFNGFDQSRDNVQIDDYERFKDTSVEIVLQKMKNPQNCIVKKGYFPDTAQHIDEEFCLVSLDGDLYNPIFTGLEYFYPRLNQGGYIFIHDFGSYHFTEVRAAVFDWLKDNRASIIPVSDICSSVIVAK